MRRTVSARDTVGGCDMPGPNDTAGAAERRNTDRRKAARPLTGEDRRKGDRRSGGDRRGAPRLG